MATFKLDIEESLSKQKTKLTTDFPDFASKYINSYLTSKSTELRSHIAYAKDLSTFLNYIAKYKANKKMNELTLDDMKNVTVDTLTDYFNYLGDYNVEYTTKTGKLKTVKRRNSINSKARKLASLKKFYLYLDDVMKIENNPTLKYNIKAAQVSKINNRLDSEEILEIENSIENGVANLTQRQKSALNRLKLRDLTIFLILSSLGLRVSELVSLDIKDVDLKRCIIRVTRKNNKIQELPYPDDITDCLETYMKYRIELNKKFDTARSKNPLFLSQRNTRISDQSVRVLLKKYCTRLGITDISCHTFRRTCLSTFYNITKDIRLTAKIGGHSVATATKYYVDVDQERLRKEVRSFSYKNKSN